MRGKSNRFGEDVDLGLLLRFSKDQELYVVEGGDMVKFVALLQGRFLMKATSLHLGNMAYVYTIQEKITVGASSGY
jgi:hypothetical protein